MWILRYRYDTEDGNWCSISCCLKQGPIYDIGRSTKSPLHIKNDKSISRKHIQLKVNKENELNVLNTGKLTTLNAEVLMVDQSLNFHPKGQLRLELGIKPIIATIEWQDQVWKVSHDLLYNSMFKRQEFNSYGISVTTTMSTRTNLQIIKQNQDTYSNCLFSLVKGIDIVRESFLSDFQSHLYMTPTDYDGIWKNLLQKHMVFPDFTTCVSIFQNISIIVASKSIYNLFKYTIEVAGGELLYCENIEKFEQFIQEAAHSKDVIILKHITEANLTNDKNSNIDISEDARKLEKLKAAAESLGYKLHDVNDLVDAVLKRDPRQLLEKIPTKISFRSEKGLEEPKRPLEIDELITPVPDKVSETAPFKGQLENSTARNSFEIMEQKIPVKRKRPNRSKVRPLDSLDFFAGGTIQAKNEGIQKNQEFGMTRVAEGNSEGFNDVDKDDVIDEENVEPPRKKPRRKPVKSLENLMMREKTQAEQHNKEIGKKPTGNECANKKPGPEDKKQKEPEAVPPYAMNEIAIILERPGQLEQSNNTASANGTRHIPVQADNCALPNETRIPPNTLLTHEGVHNHSTALVEAIQDTKSREVSRLKNTLIQIDKNELTENAINSLSNLAIVETKDLIRKNSERGRYISSDTCLWEGRKNFKKFIKVQPRRSQRETFDSDGNNIVKNSAFLITREYVPLKKFDPNEKEQIDDTFFLNHSANEGPIPAQPRRIDETSNLTDDEEGPVFNFKRTKSKDPSISPRKEQTLTNGDIEMKETSRSENRLFVTDEDDSQSLNITDNSIEAPERSISNPLRVNDKPSSGGNTPRLPRFTEASDDDDDEPRFRFRSRR